MLNRSTAQPLKTSLFRVIISSFIFVIFGCGSSSGTSNLPANDPTPAEQNCTNGCPYETCQWNCILPNSECTGACAWGHEQPPAKKAVGGCAQLAKLYSECFPGGDYAANIVVTPKCNTQGFQPGIPFECCRNGDFSYPEMGFGC